MQLHQQQTNYVKNLVFVLVAHICEQKQKRMVKEYVLKTKCGEVINKVESETIDVAVELFAEIKNLTIESLIKIYDVKPVN